MALHVHWFLPTAGDSREVVGFGPTAGRRPPSIDYLASVARTAEHLGFEAVLTPTGTWCEDAWITTAALIRETTTLKFLVAFRPGLVSPTLAAQQAASFQRFSGGRLLLNVVTGGDPVEQRRFGDWLDHDQRYERTDEFLSVLRGAFGDRPFDFEGEHLHVEGATAAGGSRLGAPTLFFGGASEAAERVAARHVDVHLSWGEPPDELEARIARVRALAQAEGRTIRFGVRLHVITRDRAADAWAEADRLVEAMTPEAIAAAQRQFAAGDSVGQRRMAALHGGSIKDLVIAPNLWAGYGLVRSGAGTALVGSHDEVAERIAEYHALGLDHVILSGQPHVEEAFWFGEGVLPRLRAAGLLAPTGRAGSEPGIAAPAEPAPASPFDAVPSPAPAAEGAHALTLVSGP